MGDITQTLCLPAPDCPGVVIEHLAINGNGQNLNGIANYYAQELSYVKDVALTGLGTGTGLWLNVHSNNSGPYTNIRYSGSGVCARITDSVTGGTINQTRGIHGLTCNMSNNSGAAVYVDSPNNSIEDVYIQGGSSQDGIAIGAHAAASNNVLFNISGVGLKNVVHICGSSNSGNCTTSGSANNVTLVGVTQSSGTNSIQDDLTSTKLTDANVAIYIVGEPIQANGSTIGYSRFTTSPNSAGGAGAVTWLVGPNLPSPLAGPCAAGSLYSCTTNSQCPPTLYGCQGSSGWKPIR